MKNFISKYTAKEYFLCALAIVGVLAICAYLAPMNAGASIAVNNTAISNQYRLYNLFASTTAESTLATTTSATSTNITAYFDSAGNLIDGTVDLRGAKKVTLYFSRDAGTGGNAGKSVFRVQTSRDGTNWDDFNKLVGADVSATATSTVTISAATSTVVVGMDILKDSFFKARCIILETTDGSHSCAAAVQY